MYATKTITTTTKTTNKSTPNILTLDDDEYPFDYDVYFYSLADSSLDPTRNEFVAYIDRYRLRSKLGQLRARFNLELKFFMSLKSLRLDYMSSLSVMEQQQPPRFTLMSVKNSNNNQSDVTRINVKSIARPKLSIRKMSSSPASSMSKIPHLMGYRPASVGDESVSSAVATTPIKRGGQTMSQRHLNHHHRELRINNNKNRFNHHMARKSFLPVRINASAPTTTTNNNVSAANVVTTTTNASQSPSSLSSFSPSSSSSSNLDAVNSQTSANLLIRVHFFFIIIYKSSILYN